MSRYQDRLGEMIDLIRAQDWYKDGLDRGESLFVERMLTYVSTKSGPRRTFITDATITGRLFLYDTVKLRNGDAEVLLIFQPNQDANKEMALIKKTIPILENTVGVEWPEKVITIINGATVVSSDAATLAAGTNQDGMIQMSNSAYLDAPTVTHELSHTYWSYSVSTPWFAEGMADVYSAYVRAAMASDPPAGWTIPAVDMEALYKTALQRTGGKVVPVFGLTANLNYAPFDAVLMQLRHDMGDDAFKAAAKQIYLTSDFGRTSLKEKRLEDIYLANTPAAAKPAVMDAFNKAVWGDNGEKYTKLVEQEVP